MSGIVALSHPDGSPVDRDLLHTLTRFMASRGPDGDGTWVGAGVGAFSVASPNWLALAILSVLSLASFAALALLVAGGGLLLGHSGPLLWLVPSISWLVGGVLYPAALLPAPLAWMAELVPLTHALDGVRGALVTGASLTDLWRPAVCLAISTVTTFVLAVLAFRGGLARARAHGDLVAA